MTTTSIQWKPWLQYPHGLTTAKFLPPSSIVFLECTMGLGLKIMLDLPFILSQWTRMLSVSIFNWFRCDKCISSFWSRIWKSISVSSNSVCPWRAISCFSSNKVLNLSSCCCNFNQSCSSNSPTSSPTSFIGLRFVDVALFESHPHWVQIMFPSKQNKFHKCVNKNLPKHDIPWWTTINNHQVIACID